MEVRPGYKQTEVGVIPGDWDVQAVGDLTTKVGSGITPTGGEKVYRREGRPFLRSQNVGWGRLLLDDIAFIDDATHDTFKATEIEVGDVFLNITGASIGRSTVADVRVEYGNVNQHVCIIRPAKSALDPYFLNYFLLSKAGQRQIDSFQAGGNRQGLNFQQIRSFQLPRPTLPEQHAIATALSDVDALLAKLDQFIAKKRDLKQAAMQQLLTGQTRLPGFSGHWDQISLGDMFSFKNGLNKGKEFFGYGTPIVNYMDVYKSSTIISSKLVGRVSLTKEEIQNFDVKKGDVFFTRTSETSEEIGMASVVLDEPIQTVFSGFILRGRPKNDRLCDEFKAYCFRSAFVRSQIISKASYTTRALTNGRILSAVVLSVPSTSEQTAIATVLSDMDAEIAALEARRDKTRALKQGMMQELLTGRIRLV